MKFVMLAVCRCFLRFRCSRTYVRSAPVLESSTIRLSLTNFLTEFIHAAAKEI